MPTQKKRFHIGLRTLKTAVAVVVSMMLVDIYGATSFKLIFATLGAMAAVQPTFKESLASCLTQIVGVIFGALIGVLLLSLPIPHLVSTGIGIILVITLYNALRIQFSPSLACIMIVILCTTPNIQPMTYSLGRVWDTAIGLGVGMLINTLIFPYDNRRQIRSTMESLDQELIRFLEDMFDGDNILPDAEKASKKITMINQQLTIFANQKLLMRPGRQTRELESFRGYEEKAHRLVAHMKVLCDMGLPGRLNDENRQRLASYGANIRDQRELNSVMERDIITNYHVDQILTLRRELLDMMKQ